MVEVTKYNECKEIWWRLKNVVEVKKDYFKEEQLKITHTINTFLWDELDVTIKMLRNVFMIRFTMLIMDNIYTGTQAILYIYTATSNPLYLHGYTSHPLYLHGYTSHPLYLHGYTSHPLYLHGYTSHPLYLHGYKQSFIFTRVHKPSFIFTRVHKPSFIFTRVHKPSFIFCHINNRLFNIHPINESTYKYINSRLLIYISNKRKYIQINSRFFHAYKLFVEERIVL